MNMKNDCAQIPPLIPPRARGLRGESEQIIFVIFINSVSSAGKNSMCKSKTFWLMGALVLMSLMCIIKGCRDDDRPNSLTNPANDGLSEFALNLVPKSNPAAKAIGLKIEAVGVNDQGELIGPTMPPVEVANPRFPLNLSLNLFRPPCRYKLTVTTSLSRSPVVSWSTIANICLGSSGSLTIDPYEAPLADELVISAPGAVPASAPVTVSCEARGVNAPDRERFPVSLTLSEQGGMTLGPVLNTTSLSGQFPDPFEFSSGQSVRMFTCTFGDSRLITQSVMRTVGRALPTATPVPVVPTPIVITATPGPIWTPTITPTPGGPTATPTPTITPGGPTPTPTLTPTITPTPTVTPTATPVMYTLSVTKTGTGTGTVTSTDTFINCGTTCSYSYTPGTLVTLQAIPDATSTFIGWTGGVCSGTLPCVVTMNAAQTVSAYFAGACEVVTESNNVPGSIQQVLQNAGTNGCSTITFAPTVNTITIISGLSVAGTLTIDGAGGGTGKVTIAGGGAGLTGFTANAGTTLTLDNLNITQFQHGIHNYGGTLLIGSGTTVSACTSTAVHNANNGSLVIDGTITGNQQGLHTQGAGSYVNLRSTARITNNNNASGYGGGIDFAEGTLVVRSGAEISGNQAQNGAGIYAHAPSGNSLTIENSAIIRDNVATQNGGGLYLGSTVSADVVTIEAGALITENRAINGAGMYTGDPCIIAGTLSGNIATSQGGGVMITGGAVTLTAGSQILGNEAPAGAGVYLQYGTLNLEGSVSGNIASNRGGGLYLMGAGGTFNILAGGSITGNFAQNAVGTATGGGINRVAGTSTVSGITPTTVNGNTADTCNNYYDLNLTPYCQF